MRFWGLTGFSDGFANFWEKLCAEIPANLKGWCLVARKIINRILISIPVLIGVVLLIFLMLNVVPGNPIAIMLKEHVKQDVIDRMTEYYGLNDPVLVQFGRYIWNALHGDFGNLP